jgi:hypothetical protein
VKQKGQWAASRGPGGVGEVAGVAERRVQSAERAERFAGASKVCRMPIDQLVTGQRAWRVTAKPS